MASLEMYILFNYPMPFVTASAPLCNVFSLHFSRVLKSMSLIHNQDEWHRRNEQCSVTSYLKKGVNCYFRVIVFSVSLTDYNSITKWQGPRQQQDGIDFYPIIICRFLGYKMLLKQKSSKIRSFRPKMWLGWHVMTTKSAKLNRRALGVGKVFLVKPKTQQHPQSNISRHRGRCDALVLCWRDKIWETSGRQL